MSYYSELDIDTRTCGEADEDARLDRRDGYRTTPATDHPTRYTLFVHTPSGVCIRRQEMQNEIEMSLRVTYLTSEGYTVNVVPRFWHAGSQRYMTVPGTEWSTER